MENKEKTKKKEGADAEELFTVNGRRRGVTVAQGTTRYPSPPPCAEKNVDIGTRPTTNDTDQTKETKQTNIT